MHIFKYLISFQGLTQNIVFIFSRPAVTFSDLPIVVYQNSCIVSNLFITHVLLRCGVINVLVSHLYLLSVCSRAINPVINMSRRR